MFSTNAFSITPGLCIVGYFLVYWTIKWNRSIPNGLRLPPGPPGLPIIGNVKDISLSRQWETVVKWSEQYGDLVYLNVLGTRMIYVNSFEVARELFERRSSLYSDRPDQPMMSLSGWDDIFAIMPYGQRWRQHRRAFHQYFNSRRVTEYHPIQLKHTHAFLKRIHDSPDEFLDHLKHLTAAIIMEVTYGIQLQAKNDPYIAIVHQALEGANEAILPEAFLVNMLPLLKYVPEWLPGAGFKTKARIWRVPTLEMVSTPFTAVKNALANGTAGPSMLASFLKKISDSEHAVEKEEIIRNACGVAYAAGAGTSVSGMENLILALVLHPEVQRKAQMELDAVIGEDRLPTFKDRAQLPYVNALCVEVQRWRPVLPLSLPHMTTQDDVYGEFFIPKGTIVMGNAWAILHSETMYGPRPEKFEPERFLEPGIKLPTAQFGFGRRICPGRYIAEGTMFILAACLLKIFNISPAKDADGNEIPVTGSWTSPGGIVGSDVFKCSFTVRSSVSARLILEAVDV